MRCLREFILSLCAGDDKFLDVLSSLLIEKEIKIKNSVESTFCLKFISVMS